MDMNKKGQALGLGALQSVAVTFVVVALVIAFGALILGETKADMTANSSEANATQDGIDAVGKLSGKLPLIAIVVVAVVVIGLLIAAFRNRG